MDRFRPSVPLRLTATEIELLVDLGRLDRCRIEPAIPQTDDVGRCATVSA